MLATLDHIKKKLVGPGKIHSGEYRKCTQEEGRMKIHNIAYVLDESSKRAYGNINYYSAGEITSYGNK